MYNLTWEEAKDAMERGDRVQNIHFTSDEYFELDRPNVIVDESGYNMNAWFRNESWQKNGWRIV